MKNRSLYHFFFNFSYFFWPKHQDWPILQCFMCICYKSSLKYCSLTCMTSGNWQEMGISTSKARDRCASHYTTSVCIYWDCMDISWTPYIPVKHHWEKQKICFIFSRVLSQDQNSGQMLHVYSSSLHQLLLGKQQFRDIVLLFKHLAS